MTISRRSILYLAGLIVLGFLLFRWRTTLKNLLFRPEAPPQPKPAFPNPFVESDRALVGLVHGDDAEQMIREALNLIGGLEKLDVESRTVLIKPNAVAGEPPPTTTNPEVLRALIKVLQQAGSKKIFVGDMSALLTLPTKRNMEKTGILKAIEEEGAEPVFFEDHKWVGVDLPRTQHVRKAYVSQWIFQVDRVINLTVIKTHRSAAYSIALKNFIGATHGRQRPYLIDASHWEEIVAELNAAYQPHLNLLDGTHVMISGGPWSGKAAKPRVIVASGDRIAADVVGLAIIKRYAQSPEVARRRAWDQRQIRRAVELVLGVKDSRGILLKSKSLIGEDPTFDHLVASVQKYAFGTYSVTRA